MADEEIDTNWNEDVDAGVVDEHEDEDEEVEEDEDEEEEDENVEEDMERLHRSLLLAAQGLLPGLDDGEELGADNEDEQEESADDRSQIEGPPSSAGTQSRRNERLHSLPSAGVSLEKTTSSSKANTFSFWAKRVSRNLNPKFLLSAFHAGKSWLTQTNKPEWTRLPDTVLVIIFQMLSDEDRVRTSSVCKRWRWILYAPELWRRRTVCLNQKGLQFVKVFGSFVRELTLSLNPFDWCLESAQIILSHLKASRIRVLEIR